MPKSKSGWHFLQIPGPSNVPGRVLRAMARPTIDHRGPEFSQITQEVLEGLRWIVGSEHPVIVYPSSGTGAWEAALVNTMSPGERILMFETGHFGVEWAEVARRLGLDVDFVPGDWRHGVDPGVVEERLRGDKPQTYKAIAVLHNETSTGAVSRIPEIREAIDRTGHPALLMVDTISSLGSVEYQQDAWGVDVTVAASQKGLMLPPGLAFTGVSPKAIEASRKATLPRSYWEWSRMIEQNEKGFFPFTPATNLVYGLRESLAMFREAGLESVLARHTRHGEATRRAVAEWGLEIQCSDPREYSGVLTGVRVPDGHNADTFRALVLDRFNLSLGTGLGKLKGDVFRIGHLGDFNDLMLFGTLSGIESGLALAGIPLRRGGVEAAMTYLEQSG
jgi:alanine-glyoxylate transaminase/serine-glyoxylate transaminase/serine-pyruvate transaminase